MEGKSIKALRTLEAALREAILEAQNAQLGILDEGQGRLSADFRFAEALESDYLVPALHRLGRYRDQLPYAHPWSTQK